MNEMEREERCPWNPFPIDSEWGRALDRNYRRRFKRRAGDKMVQVTTADAIAQLSEHERMKDDQD